MFCGLFLNKRKEKELEKVNSVPCPKSEYSFVMEHVNFTLGLEESLEDKINMVNFFMEIIRKDIQYDLMSKFLYSEMDGIYIDVPFPLTLMSKDVNATDKAILINGEKEIDLSRDTVILLPWDRHAFSYTVKSICKNGFKYIRSNHKAYYYSDIDLAYVYRGNHSIATGAIKRTGKIKAMEYDIKNLFKILTTDGRYWYVNGEKHLTEVFDFRIAALYEMAKLKHVLQNNNYPVCGRV